jgi:hypothetical protein
LEFKGRRLPNTFGGGGQSILKKRRIALSIELFGMAMCQEMSALLMGKKKRLLLNGGSL